VALGESRSAGALGAVNRRLIRLRKQLFSYQMFVVAQARPSLAYLLEAADAASNIRAESSAGPR
jgi:hypothetical protein